MPIQISTLALFLLGSAILLGLGWFGIASLGESEWRAARVAFLATSGAALLFAGTAFLPPAVQWGLLSLSGLVGLAGLVLFLLPVGRVDPAKDAPLTRYDERDVMFARARLVPGSPEYQAYYEMRPENKTGDDLTRSKPGLLSLKAAFADPFLFASPEASFALTGALRQAVDGPVSSVRYTLPVGDMTRYVKDLAVYYGALEVGIAGLEPCHVYSHVGRGSGVYGAPIPLEHPYAIAFTVEMDFQMIGANPAAPGVMESAKEYVEAARVAVQLAAAIRYWGYSARAHIDGDYRVIAPLVARDAGLGEIGRMGLLMTPRQGPRVRLGVVTTDLPLLADRKTRDGSVIDFCRVCKKCATNCPTKSIPLGDRQEIDGALRWRIDADACFRYWNVVGTDCGRCMTVCPYSRPDSLAHHLVRWGSARSGFFRRVAIRLDDVFYGAKPPQRPAPRWTRLSTTTKE
jgi:ferredoxin